LELECPKEVAGLRYFALLASKIDETPIRKAFGDGNDEILTTRMVADYLHCHLR